MSSGVVSIALAGLVSWNAGTRPATAASSRPQFATASVEPSTAAPGDSGGVRLQPGGGPPATGVTPRQLVNTATRDPFDCREVEGGPPWFDTDRFDVVAKAPAEHSIGPDGSFSETWAMVRALLAERFRLKAHDENRERPVYALTLATSARELGSRLRPTESDCGAATTQQRPAPRPGNGPPCSIKTPPGRLFANTASMTTLASLISRHVDRDVVDATGLAGRFDVELEAAEIEAPPDYGPGPSDLALPPASGPSILVAVRAQLRAEARAADGGSPRARRRLWRAAASRLSASGSAGRAAAAIADHKSFPPEKLHLKDTAAFEPRPSLVKPVCLDGGPAVLHQCRIKPFPDRKRRSLGHARWARLHERSHPRTPGQPRTPPQ